jgi:DNA-binding XRE family transcriptional regulator
MSEYDIVFKEFRKKAGLTRSQIGKELGISRFQIFLWEWSLWSPNESVREELKIYLAKFVERSLAAIIGTGLVATAGWLTKIAVADPEPTSKVAAGLGAGTLAAIGGMCLYFAATGETIVRIKIGREIISIPKK